MAGGERKLGFKVRLVIANRDDTYSSGTAAVTLSTITGTSPPESPVFRGAFAVN